MATKTGEIWFAKLNVAVSRCFEETIDHKELLEHKSQSVAC